MSGAFETIDSPIHSTGAGLLLYALNKYKIKINNKELNQLKKLDEIIILILKKVKK